MSFPSIDSPYRISSASTTYMHTCLLRATGYAPGQRSRHHLAEWENSCVTLQGIYHKSPRRREPVYGGVGLK
jgi:hypothetical protein